MHEHVAHENVRRPAGWRFRTDAAWLSVVVIVFVAFFWQATIQGRFFIVGDSWAWALPLRAIAWDQLRHGRVPGWTETLMGGYPLLSMAQLALGYPLTWLHLFDEAWGEQVYVLAPFVLSPIFTYAYARSVGRSRGAALLAGLSFGYGGAMCSSITHAGMVSNGFMWLPVVLACVERCRRQPFIPCLVGASLAYGMAVLTGMGQAFLLNGLVIGSYCAFCLVALEGSAPWRSWRRWRVPAVGFLGILLGGCLGAFQIFETERAHRLSVRNTLSFQVFSQGSSRLANVFDSLLAPKFTSIADVTAYVAPLTLVLAVVALLPRFYRRARDYRVLFWAAVAFVSWWLMLGAYTPLYRLLYHVPVINQFRVPPRHSLEWTFAASMLGAYGWDALAEWLGGITWSLRERSRAVVAVGLLSLTALSAVYWLSTTPTPTRLVYLSAKAAVTLGAVGTLGAVLALGRISWHPAIFGVLVPLATVTEAYVCQTTMWVLDAKSHDRVKMIAPVTRSLLEKATTEHRVYSHLEAFIDGQTSTPRVDAPNRTGWLGLHDVGGYEPLFLERLSKALGGADLFAMTPDHMPHAALGDAFNHRSVVLDLLNATYVVRALAPDEPVIPAEWQRSPPLDRVVLDIGQGDSRSAFESGLSGNEVLGGRSGVWTDGSVSKFAFRLLPKPGAYQLTLVTGSFTPATPLEVRVVINGKTIGKMPIIPGWIERSVRVPAGTLIDGKNRVELRYSRTKRPAETVEGSTDRRALALFIDSLALTPM